MSGRLPDSPALILATFIIENAAKMTDPSDGDTWPLYISSMPDGHDVESNCGTTYDVSGIKDGRLMKAGLVIEYWKVSLDIRCTDYEIGRAKLEDIDSSLDGIDNDSVVVGDNTYEIQNASRQEPIIFLGVDEKRRNLFRSNLLLCMKLT